MCDAVFRLNSQTYKRIVPESKMRERVGGRAGWDRDILAGSDISLPIASSAMSSGARAYAPVERPLRGMWRVAAGRCFQRAPSLRSGVWLAAQTPPKRLNFDCSAQDDGSMGVSREIRRASSRPNHRLWG